MNKLTINIIMLLLSLTALNSARANFSCGTDAGTKLDFSNSEHISGDDNGELGATWRFSSVLPGGVDAVVTVIDSDGAYIVNNGFDLSNQGLSDAFQPRITTDTYQEGYAASMTFRIDLVEQGSETLIDATGLNFQLTSNDIDGASRNMEVREYVEFTNFYSYIVDSQSDIIASIDGDRLRLIPNGNGNVGGITSRIENSAMTLFKDVNSFEYTIGIDQETAYDPNGGGNIKRKFSLLTTCTDYEEPVIVTEPSLSLSLPSMLESGSTTTLTYLITNPNTEVMNGSLVLDLNTLDDHTSTTIVESEYPLTATTSASDITAPEGSTVSVMDGSLVYVDGISVSANSEVEITVAIQLDEDLVDGEYYMQDALANITIGGTVKTRTTVMSDDASTEIAEDPTKTTVIRVTNSCEVSGDTSGTDVSIPHKLDTASWVTLPVTLSGTNNGDIRGYVLDAQGEYDPASPTWSANLQSSETTRSSVLKANYNGTLYRIASVMDTAFEVNGLPTVADIKNSLVSPSTNTSILNNRTSVSSFGGFSDGNGMTYVSNRVSPLRYLNDASYKSYYNSSIKDRVPLAIVASDDGFVYALDAGTGRTIWGFMPGAFLSDVKDFEFVENGNNVGKLEVIETQDANGSYATYLVGSYRSGEGHYSVKLVQDNLGYLQLGELVFETTDGGTAGEDFVTYASGGDTYLAYVTSDSLVIKKVNGEDSAITIASDPTGSIYYSNTMYTNTIYVPSGNKVKLFQVENESGTTLTTPTTMEITIPGVTEDIKYVSVVSIIGGHTMLSVQTDSSVTMMKYNRVDSEWIPVWKTDQTGGKKYVNGSFQSTADIITVESGAVFTGKGIIAAETLVVPVSIIDNSGCSSVAKYYVFDIRTGEISESLEGEDGQSINSSIVTIGTGVAHSAKLTEVRGDSRLALYGKASSNAVGIPDYTKLYLTDKVTTGRRSWRELR